MKRPISNSHYFPSDNVVLTWLLCIVIMTVSSIQCNNDRRQEKGHLSKRQALKRKQFEAMRRQEEVNSVVNQLDEELTTSPVCARFTRLTIF